MLLNDVLDEVITLLEHPEFKNFGAWKKHQYQMLIKQNPEYADNSRMKYKGCKIGSEAAKKGHANRQFKEQINKMAACTRSDWYKKHPENYAKFMEAIRRRDARKKYKKLQEQKALEKKKAKLNQSVQK